MIHLYSRALNWQTLPCHVLPVGSSCLTLDSASSHFSSASRNCGYTYQNGVPKKDVYIETKLIFIMKNFMLSAFSRIAIFKRQQQYSIHISSLSTKFLFSYNISSCIKIHISLVDSWKEAAVMHGRGCWKLRNSSAVKLWKKDLKGMHEHNN